LTQTILIKGSTEADLQLMVKKSVCHRDVWIIADGKEQREGVHDGAPPNPPVLPKIGADTIPDLMFRSNFKKMFNFVQTFPEGGSTLS
jgi:hypothetical protein